MSNSTKEETDLDEEAARRALDFYLNPTPTCEEVLCMALSERKGEEAGRKWKSQERRGPEEETAEKPVPNRR